MFHLLRIKPVENMKLNLRNNNTIQLLPVHASSRANDFSLPKTAMCFTPKPIAENCSTIVYLSLIVTWYASFVTTLHQHHPRWTI